MNHHNRQGDLQFHLSELEIRFYTAVCIRHVDKNVTHIFKLTSPLFEGGVYVNICGIPCVNLTYTDENIRRHLGLLAEMVLKFSLTGMMLRNG